MGVSNSPGNRMLIELEQRKSCSFVVKVIDPQKNAVDLTGVSIRMFVNSQRPGHEEVLMKQAYLIEPATGGSAQFDIQARELDFAVDEYYFTISMTTDKGYSSVIVKGALSLLPNGDDQSANIDFTLPGYPAFTLLVTLDPTGRYQAYADSDTPYPLVLTLLHEALAAQKAAQEAKAFVQQHRVVALPHPEYPDEMLRLRIPSRLLVDDNTAVRMFVEREEQP